MLTAPPRRSQGRQAHAAARAGCHQQNTRGRGASVGRGVPTRSDKKERMAKEASGTTEKGGLRSSKKAVVGTTSPWLNRGVYKSALVCGRARSTLNHRACSRRTPVLGGRRRGRLCLGRVALRLLFLLTLQELLHQLLGVRSSRPARGGWSVSKCGACAVCPTMLCGGWRCPPNGVSSCSQVAGCYSSSTAADATSLTYRSAAGRCAPWSYPPTHKHIHTNSPSPKRPC